MGGGVGRWPMEGLASWSDLAGAGKGGDGGGAPETKVHWTPLKTYQLV